MLRWAIVLLVIAIIPAIIVLASSAPLPRLLRCCSGSLRLCVADLGRRLTQSVGQCFGAVSGETESCRWIARPEGAGSLVTPLASQDARTFAARRRDVVDEIRDHLRAEHSINLPDSRPFYAAMRPDIVELGRRSWRMLPEDAIMVMRRLRRAWRARPRRGRAAALTIATLRLLLLCRDPRCQAGARSAMLATRSLSAAHLPIVREQAPSTIRNASPLVVIEHRFDAHARRVDGTTATAALDVPRLPLPQPARHLATVHRGLSGACVTLRRIPATPMLNPYPMVGTLRCRHHVPRRRSSAAKDCPRSRHRETPTSPTTLVRPLSGLGHAPHCLTHGASCWLPTRSSRHRENHRQRTQHSLYQPRGVNDRLAPSARSAYDHRHRPIPDEAAAWPAIPPAPSLWRHPRPPADTGAPPPTHSGTPASVLPSHLPQDANGIGSHHCAIRFTCSGRPRNAAANATPPAVARLRSTRRT